MNNRQQVVILLLTAGASAWAGGGFLANFIFQGSMVGFGLGLLAITCGMVATLKATDLLNKLD